MKKSQLENIYRKTLTEKSLKAYKKQKNYVSRLYKNKKKNVPSIHQIFQIIERFLKL